MRRVGPLRGPRQVYRSLPGAALALAPGYCSWRPPGGRKGRPLIAQGHLGTVHGSGDEPKVALEGGEELAEGGFESGAVVLEVAGGGGEFDVVAAGVEAGGEAGEGEGDAIEGG